jgi:LysM repeat protein
LETTPAAAGPTTVASASETEGDEEAPDVDAEAEESDEPPMHIVQAGDTLGKISDLYEVPVEDIAAANDIVNVNSIAVGQQLIIPVGGLAETAEGEGVTDGSADETAPTEEVPPTPLPTEPPAQGTAIVEVSEVIGVGELAEEAVRITNAGTRPVALQEWELLDEEGHVYTFAAVTLYGSSEAGSPSILVHTETGQNGASNLFWGQEEAVWEQGETVTLRDAEGSVQATYVIP